MGTLNRNEGSSPAQEAPTSPLEWVETADLVAELRRRSENLLFYAEYPSSRREGPRYHLFWAGDIVRLVGVVDLRIRPGLVQAHDENWESDDDDGEEKDDV